MNNTSAFLQSLPLLQHFLKENTTEVEDILQRAHQANPWFIPAFSRLAIHAIANDFLDEGKVTRWMNVYEENPNQRTVGIVMAGNLPLVGFHDLICVLASGHKAIVKCSDKDSVLPPWIIDQWVRFAPGLKSSITLVDRLEGYDAVIATGSNNTARYFEYYFRSHPHILRKNRNGVAVLTGKESFEELKLLANDIFQYFGMGCRNVSKLYVPSGYDFSRWQEAIEAWAFLGEHHKYRHNLDYNYAIYIINQVPHINLGHLVLKEDDSIASRIGCLHYSYYEDQGSLERTLNEKREEIQCVVSNEEIKGWERVRFGETQQPRLDQYADGVDTMAFLAKI
jgi:hypothetical protein